MNTETVSKPTSANPLRDGVECIWAFLSTKIPSWKYSELAPWLLENISYPRSSVLVVQSDCFYYHHPPPPTEKKNSESLQPSAHKTGLILLAEDPFLPSGPFLSTRCAGIWQDWGQNCKVQKNKQVATTARYHPVHSSVKMENCMPALAQLHHYLHLLASVARDSTETHTEMPLPSSSNCTAHAHAHQLLHSLSSNVPPGMPAIQVNNFYIQHRLAKQKPWLLATAWPHQQTGTKGANHSLPPPPRTLWSEKMKLADTAAQRERGSEEHSRAHASSLPLLYRKVSRGQDTQHPL